MKKSSTTTCTTVRALRRITSFVAPLLFLASLNAGAQWKSVKPAGLTMNMYGVDFPTAMVGYATGWDPTGSVLAKTTDGGETWAGQTLAGALLFEPEFVSAETGLIAGYLDACACGLIMKTTDGGAEWATGTNPSTYGFYSYAFPSAETGYICGYNGMIMKTTDAGSNWQVLPTGTQNVFRNIFFPTVDVGYAIAGKGNDFSRPVEMYKTTNGGQSWTMIQDYSESRTIADLYFISADVGFFVGHDGAEAIYRTVDGGVTWTKVSTGPATEILQAISFNDANTGVAVGTAGRILHTADGGATWTLEQSGTTEALLEVDYTGGNAVAVGFGGTIQRRTSGASVPVEEMERGMVTISPNPITTSATVRIANIPAGMEYSFTIHDMTGREVRSMKGRYDGTSFEISRGGLASGAYFYRFAPAKGNVVSGGIIVK